MLKLKEALSLEIPKTALASNIWIGHFVGRLDALGADSKILLRPNDVDSDYVQFSYMNGNATSTEQPTNGIYVGRNGWGKDASFSFEVILSLRPGHKRTYHCMSTFAHGDESILGYRCHGFWGNTNDSISTIKMYTYGTNPGDIDGVWITDWR